MLVLFATAKEPYIKNKRKLEGRGSVIGYK